MAVMIKGMELPNSCWRCPLCLTVDPDTYRCMVTGDNFPAIFDAIDHIVLPCPLVELPPHGVVVGSNVHLNSREEIVDKLLTTAWRFAIYDDVEIVEVEDDDV